MAPVFDFSEEEQSCLRSHSIQWTEATTAIGKQNISDEAANQVMLIREETLKTPLSPREKHALFEVFTVMAISGGALSLRRFKAVCSWYCKGFRRAMKVKGGETIGRVNARVLLARTKPRTIREIQKRLFEKGENTAFPYSVNNLEDKELPPLTEDDLLAIDGVGSDDNGSDDNGGDELGGSGSESDIEDAGGTSDAGDAKKAGAALKGNAGAASASSATQKELARITLGYFQKAVTVAMKNLSPEEKRQYELKAKLARAKGLTEEDKKRNVEGSLKQALRKSAEHLWNHYGAKVVFAVTFEDSEGTIRAVMEDFNEELGGGALVQFAKRDWVRDGGNSHDVAAPACQGALPLMILPTNAAREPILPDPRKVPGTKELDWLITLFRSFFAAHYGLASGKTDKASPPWSSISEEPSRYFPEGVLPAELASMIKEPSKMGKAKLLQVLTYLYEHQETNMLPLFHFIQHSGNMDGRKENGRGSAGKKGKARVSDGEQSSTGSGKGGPVLKALPSPETTPGLSPSPLATPQLGQSALLPTIEEALEEEYRFGTNYMPTPAFTPTTALTPILTADTMPIPASTAIAERLWCTKFTATPAFQLTTAFTMPVPASTALTEHLLLTKFTATPASQPTTAFTMPIPASTAITEHLPLTEFTATPAFQPTTAFMRAPKPTPTAALGLGPVSAAVHGPTTHETEARTAFDEAPASPQKRSALGNPKGDVINAEGTTRESADGSNSMTEITPGVWASSPLRKPAVSASQRLQLSFKPKPAGRTLEAVKEILTTVEESAVDTQGEPSTPRPRMKGRRAKKAKKIADAGEENNAPEDKEPVQDDGEELPGQPEAFVRGQNQLPAQVQPGLAKGRPRRTPNAPKRIY
ncbi:hypothetical protein BKA70DRAFT_1440059 [Coprinopsis sp. MPI-PUGE-AT-0042]|nr:hypothetical protein BKA70DRAFT_1440059 [Coprinopsis sp. MPI-PUGE-AT-0042]